MKRFYPQTGTDEEWNMAYYRLEDYFRAHHVTNKVHQSQMILRLLERAAARHLLEPNQAPTKLAMEEAYAVMDRWFQRLLPEEPEARAPVVGRVGMYMLGATEQWPNLFLADDHEIPISFRKGLGEITLQSGPDLRISSMVPRPLDISPADEPVEETWERLGRLSMAVLIGMLLLFAGSAVYYFSN
jgi:hypothetical protein